MVKVLWDVSFKVDKGVVLEANEAIHRLTGYTKEELIGKNILQVLAHPDDIDKRTLPMPSVINNIKDLSAADLGEAGIVEEKKIS